MSYSKLLVREAVPKIRVQCLDGSRFGWVSAVWDGNYVLTYSYSSLAEANLANFNLNLIDMPIGLPDRGRRSCDGLARANLITRKSSIFTTPCRDAAMAESYEEACEINLKLQGIKLSKQSWNILPKIMEVDALLRADKHLLNLVKESHPELCFQSINQGLPLKFNKASEEGQRERLRLLAEIFSSTQLPDLNSGIPRSLIVDAIDAVSMVANYLFKHGNLRMLGDGELDRYGIQMGIWI